MKYNKLPKYEIVSRHLRYNKDTGEITRITSTPGRPIKERKTGRVNSSNYLQICLLGKRYVAHRLAWLLSYKKDPYPYEIDHIDLNKLNNQLSNLRIVTRSQNQRNRKLRKDNTSGVTGVHKSGNGWSVQICGNFIGKYRTFQKACEVRRRQEEITNYFN